MKIPKIRNYILHMKINHIFRNNYYYYIFFCITLMGINSINETFNKTVNYHSHNLINNMVLKTGLIFFM